MSIRLATFDLCKALSAMPDLSKLVEATRRISNTHLHYLGHGQHAQTFGFLFIDSNRSEYEKPPISIKLEALPPDVCEVFTAYHQQLVEINTRCIERLVNFKPNCSPQVLSPYNRFAPITAGTVTTKYEFFPRNETEALIDQFQRHPLVQIAMDSSAIVGPAFSSAHYVNAVLTLEQEVKEQGPIETPRRIKQILERMAPSSGPWLETQHLAAVLGLKASLAILNQLLYTKVFMTKLPCLDRDNVVSFGSYSFATGGTKLVYQEGGLMFVVETDDVIVLKDVPPREDATNFCRVERLSPFIPPMPGETRYIELLEIDENLNPYGILFTDFYYPRITK